MTNAQILGYIYTNETLRKGMEVLMPNLNANSKYLQEYIYGTSATEK